MARCLWRKLSCARALTMPLVHLLTKLQNSLLPSGLSAQHEDTTNRGPTANSNESATHSGSAHLPLDFPSLQNTGKSTLFKPPWSVVLLKGQT